MAERDPGLNSRQEHPAYEQDYAAWLNSQMELLRQRRFKELDLENLLEEVGDLGRSDFRSFVSAVEVVVAHMLKWDFQPSKRGTSWIASIEEHRARIEEALEVSPSYKSKFEEAMRRAYRPARAIASRQTKLPMKSFPDTCPYGWEQIMERPHHLDS
jgi:hypothetical protein